MTDVILSRDGQVGRITLDRPGALHALTAEMTLEITRALTAWADDPGVALVLLDHAGVRGFCAGGDIRRLAEHATEDPAALRAFFLAEYRLNDLMQGYRKPIVAVMDGVVMGGGAGIALPALYRVATERTLFAMPETAIGFFPDVGSSWRLPRMPGRIGWWLALTGARIGPADCLLTGVATDYVETARIEAFKAALIADPAGVERILTEFEADAGRPPLADHRDLIARAFDAESVEAVIAALEADGGAWAAEQAALLRARSPQSLKVTFRQMRLGAGMESFTAVMAMEYALAVRIAARPDFREGVRAVVVDKDHRPRWSPASLDEVGDDTVAEIFQPLPSAEAWTPLPSAQR